MSKKLICLACLVLVMSIAGNASADLVAHWRFDESSGTTALDSSGNGLNGTLGGDPQWVAGAIGGALEFDGDDYVDFGAPAVFDFGTEDFTITAWIKMTATTRGSIFAIGGDDGGGIRYTLAMGEGNDNKLTLTMDNDSSKNQSMGDTIINDGVWHHVVGMIKGDVSLVYVDGVEDGTIDLPEGYDLSGVLQHNAFVGAITSNASNTLHADKFMIGLIDDVRIYDTALTEPEIQAAMKGEAYPHALSPEPADGALIEDTWANLSWRAGDFAVSHDVYVGENFDDVNDGAEGTFRGNQAETYLVAGFPGFAYPDGLIRGTTYYWRIDEVNDTEPNSPWKGNVWSFKIANYLVVDDFEDYNDYPPDEIFSTWIDGYEVATNGALVGNDTFPFAEQSIVHSGAQSMPYFYDNSGTANYSEVERTFSPAQDWTRESVKVLSLRFKGYPAYMGSFVEGPTGTFTMTAEGVDIWDTSDQFHFAYKELSGAGTIIAKVESVENTHEWAKAGVMIRDTLDADSRHAMMVVTPTQGVSFQRRTQAGSSSSDTTVAGITAPQWVKLERTIGGLVRAYYSADGTTWTQLGTQTVTMSTPMYIGLALTSHNSGVACEAKFSNITSDGTGSWVDEDIGLLSNEAEPMYVTVKDSSGTAATVYHDDPDASQVSTWTEWRIDLKEVGDAGVVLTDVSNLAIGFSGADDPQAGGSGTMYFDDIRLYRAAP